VAESLRRRMVK